MIATPTFPTLLKFPLGGAQQELERVTRMFGGAFAKPFRGAFAPPTTAAVTTLILDQFTAANGTNIHGRTPSPTNTPGGTWNVFNGAGDIQSNKLNSNSTFCWAIVTAGVTDYTVSATIVLNASGSANARGIIVRSTSNASANYAVGLNQTTNRFGIFNGANDDELEGVDFTYGAGTYQIVCICNGANLIATLNGSNQVMYGSATSSSREYVGVRTRFDQETVDDFTVTVP